MSLIASTSQSDFELAPAGTTVGICYRVIDLGTQKSVGEWGTKIAKKINLSWELPNEKMSDGEKIFSVHKRYTLSLHEKAILRQDLDSWRGVPFNEDELKAFDVSKLLGKPCLIGIVHQTKDGKTYANISSILRLPKGMEIPAPVNQQVQFDLDNFDQAVYDSFSEGLKATIAKSPEYQHLKGAHNPDPNTAPERDNVPAHFDDEIPF